MPSNKRFVPNEQFYAILYTSMTLNKVAENCHYFFLFGSLSKINFTLILGYGLFYLLKTL